MDQGRRADLKMIDDRLATRKTLVTKDIKVVGRDARGRNITELVKTENYNPKFDRWGKEQAARARAGIIADSKDKKLASLRQKLIRAVKAGDKQAELQLTAKIKAHKGEHFEDYS
jgi:hypothetical protein